MAKFHSLSIKELDRPTDESVAITFDVPNELTEEFQFIQGQHLTLKHDIDGEDTRRTYSLCTCPLDNDLTVVVKKLKGGRFSSYANESLKVGDSLEVMPPHGSFHTQLDPKNEKSYVAFSAGSGITPIISILETTLRTEPNSDFTLFYGNRKTSTIIFHERLEALKNKYMGRLSVYHVLEQEKQESDLFNGMIDEEKIKAFASVFFDPSTTDEFFTCGPEPMMLKVREILSELGVAEEKIHLELFTSPLGKLGGTREVVEHEKAQSEITIMLDGNSFTFPYDSKDSILDVAFQNGADLPYACKGGVCSTCVARLEEGDVEMDINYALEPDELAKGLVLTCQSRPKTETVKLSFDV